MTLTLQLVKLEKRDLVKRIRRLIREYEELNESRMWIDLDYWLNNMVAYYVDDVFTIIYTKDGLALKIWKGSSISVNIYRVPEGEV